MERRTLMNCWIWQTSYVWEFPQDEQLSSPNESQPSGERISCLLSSCKVYSGVDSQVLLVTVESPSDNTTVCTTQADNTTYVIFKTPTTVTSGGRHTFFQRNAFWIWRGIFTILKDVTIFRCSVIHRNTFLVFLILNNHHYGWYIGEWWTHTCTSLRSYASSALLAWVYLCQGHCHHCCIMAMLLWPHLATLCIHCSLSFQLYSPLLESYGDGYLTQW